LSGRQALLVSDLQARGIAHNPTTYTQVSAIYEGNAQLLGRALDSDVIVEPVRGALIPGFR
jgi:homoserine kinase